MLAFLDPLERPVGYGVAARRKTPQRGFRRPAKPGLSVHNLRHKTCQCLSPAISRRCLLDSCRIKCSSSAPANLVITSRSIPGGRRANGERARRGDQSQPLSSVVAGAVCGCSIDALRCDDIVSLPRARRELGAMWSVGRLPRARRRQTWASPGVGRRGQTSRCRADSAVRVGTFGRGGGWNGGDRCERCRFPARTPNDNGVCLPLAPYRWKRPHNTQRHTHRRAPRALVAAGPSARDRGLFSNPKGTARLAGASGMDACSSSGSSV